MKSEFDTQLAQGERFQFGKNWKNFLSILDQEKIDQSKQCLSSFLDKTSIEGLTFLDVGCGSGLSSLAARQLGARVVSFDFDPESVTCTQTLKSEYYPNDNDWIIQEGSILSQDFLNSLGQFDIVYSWGVLHHTGFMYDAFEHLCPLVKPEGSIFIAIYNYQPYWSKFYLNLKKSYVKSPAIISCCIAGLYILSQVTIGLVRDIIGLKNPLQRYRDKVKERGMSKFYDWIDWVGGYPFEVARPEEVFHFFNHRGFELANLKTIAGGLGCNEFLFRKKLYTQNSNPP